MYVVLTAFSLHRIIEKYKEFQTQIAISFMIDFVKELYYV